MSSETSPTVEPAVASPPPPPPTTDAELDRHLRSARRLALPVAMAGLAGFLVIVALAAAGLVAARSYEVLAVAAYCLVSAGVNALAWWRIPAMIVLASQRKFGALRLTLLVWLTVCIVFFVAVGVVLARAWARIDLKDPAFSPNLPSVPPVCLRCGTRATLIPEYGRYYCYRCSAYLW
jgi:hypothetical protein